MRCGRVGREGCSPASDDAVGSRRTPGAGWGSAQASGGAIEETKLEAGWDGFTLTGVGERMRREQENAAATSALLAARGDGTDKEGRRRSSSSFIPMYFVLSIASAGKKNMRLLESWKLCGGSTQMLIEMVLDLGAVVLNCRESDHEFVVTINIFLALGLITGGYIVNYYLLLPPFHNIRLMKISVAERAIVVPQPWQLQVFLVMVFVKKKNLLTSMQANKTRVSLSAVISGAWHMTYLWQLNIDAAPLQMMMEKELMSEIKVMDMVWNCKFFGTPLLFMDIMVIDDCSRFRIGCLPGNLILTCFSQGAFVDPRKHREIQKVKFERTESYGAYEHQTLVS
uniref:OSJNBa0083D01.23 protein n=1 Tax=Oryza sativa subsp. japonica TaxID=39947 RepID=Q7X8A4_ORYSJ|nr:OSJNBb0089B03.2 [Oryza sativa Japonica Group]CAE05701.1 OSJNBa0083D01.23 [Oryza sativa Japonica Group]